MSTNQIVYHNKYNPYDITISIAQLKAFSCANNNDEDNVFWVRTLHLVYWAESAKKGQLYLSKACPYIHATYR